MKKRYTFLPKNWIRFGLATAFTISFSLNIQAQTAPAKQWDKTFGGNSVESLNSIQQTTDGGYIIGGSSFSGISGNKTQAYIGGADYWVVKIDANGNKVWDATLGGSSDDYLRSLQQTSDGGYILGGSSDSNISGNKSQANKGVPNTKDYWILKLDATGNKIWDKTIGGNGNDEFFTLQQTSDGGFILGGDSQSGISGDKSQPAVLGSGDYWIIKLDTYGNKIWDKTFGGNRGDILKALQQTSDGGYILGGISWSDLSADKTQPLKGFADYWIIKLDNNGNKIWDKTFGGNGIQYFSCLQQTSDGGYVVGGYAESGIGADKSQNSKGTYDYWVVKIDATGNKAWDKTIGSIGYDYLASIKQTSDGGYILGGDTDSGISADKSEPNIGGDDYWLVKLDHIGNKLWDKAFGGNNNDSFTSFQTTSDGGLILAGASISNVSGDKTQASQGSSDYWIVKLAAGITGINESEASFNLSISPNPNQGKFNLQLSNLTSPKAEITISDLLGRVVLQKEVQTTNNQLSEEFTLPNAKGIYLLQLKAGEQILTRKIVVE